MAKNLQLNGMIHDKFSNESAMAAYLGWSRQHLNNITTGKKLPNLFEVNVMAKALGVEFMKVARFFMPEESTTVDEPVINPLDYYGGKRVNQ